MASTTVDLDEQRRTALERLASGSDRSVHDLVRQAIDEYLERRDADEAWRQRFEDVVARIRADVTAAREEVRRERRAARGG